MFFFLKKKKNTIKNLSSLINYIEHRTLLLFFLKKKINKKYF